MVLQGRKKGFESITISNSDPSTEYEPLIVLPKAVTSKLPVELSPEKLPPWLNTADLALFNTSSDEPENGILKLQDILKTKIYIGIRSWNSTEKKE